MRHLKFRGENWLSYQSKEPEVLNSGPAGSGKTLMWLAKCYAIAAKYDGARILIARKTRESLTESVLVTWERDILGPHHSILSKNPTLRRVRQSYRFPNRSEVVVGGLDKPDKILSSEWDMIYVPEAIELTITDWETLGGRLRSGICPFQQLAADCNPTTPTHWLFKRQSAGQMRMYHSTHKDNPRYWEREKNDWTEAGRQYLERLSRMTGARRKRFLEGIWAAAEGLVFDGYDPAIHLLPESFIAPRHWTRVWGIDWGFTNPTVLGIWAIDPDGRAYLIREYYATRTRAETLAKWAKDIIARGDEPAPSHIVCDHDPECAATWQVYFGMGAEMADKTDKCWGIEQMQERFDLCDDGKPRIYFHPKARQHEPDSHLSGAGKPTSGIEELSSYVWDTKDPDRLKDEPVKKDDHFCDSARYVMRYLANAHDGSAFAAANAPRLGKRITDSLRPGTFRR
jgi:PBSX family phage terminase large subunit